MNINFKNTKAEETKKYTALTINKDVAYTTAEQLYLANETEHTTILRCIIQTQESRINRATEVYNNLKATIRHQELQISADQRLIKKLEREINSLKAYQYKTHKEPAKSTDYSYSKSVVEETFDSHSKNIDKTESARWESINKNKRVIGKPCTEAQLMTILKFGCKYENVSSPEGYLTVQQASDIIKSLMSKQKAGELVKREKPYNPDQVLLKFYSLHPGFARDIMNRDAI